MGENKYSPLVIERNLGLNKDAVRVIFSDGTEYKLLHCVIGGAVSLDETLTPYEKRVAQQENKDRAFFFYVNGTGEQLVHLFYQLIYKYGQQMINLFEGAISIHEEMEKRKNL